MNDGIVEGGSLPRWRCRGRVLLAYLTVVLIWATTPLAIQWGAVGTGFSFAASSRMVLAWLCGVLVLWAWRMQLPRHPRALLSYLLAGGGLFGAMACVYWAAERLDSGLMSVIFGLSPWVTSLLAALWLRDRPVGALRWLGMGLGLAGLMVLFLDEEALGWSHPQAPAAVLLVLLGVFINAACLVGLKWLGPQGPPLTTTVGGLWVAAPLFLLLWGLDGAGAPVTWPGWQAVGSILYLGVIGSVFGFALYYYIVQELDAGRVALILVITPLMALWIGRLFNGEVLPPRVWWGALVIALGLCLDHVGQWRRRRDG